MQFSPYEGRLALNVRKTDGTNGVIGLDGTDDVIMVNDMGTVAVTREEYTSYTIHTFGKTE